MCAVRCRWLVSGRPVGRCLWLARVGRRASVVICVAGAPMPTLGRMCRAWNVWVVGELVKFNVVVAQVPYRTWITQDLHSRPMGDHTQVITNDVLEVFVKIP